MNKIIGIRREDKNQWERRVPLIPEHVKLLTESQGIATLLQPSPIRIYGPDEYLKAGADVNEDLSAANPIFAVKEIPASFYEADKTYIFFAHVIKGQPYNMDMLRRMMELKVNLIDYERIVDENNRRLIFFGRFAGLAGMIETFYAYGQKLKARGIDSAFAQFKQAYEYASLDEAKEAITKIGEDIKANGLSAGITPVITGFAGYGNVSLGAQEIFDLLPHEEITPTDLLMEYERLKTTNKLYKVVFKETDMVVPKTGKFDLQDYYKNPQKYDGIFEQYLPCLTLLVNCIYWTPAYPRLVTRKFLQSANNNNKLQVIGDISCDVDGSIEITHKVTYPDKATFTYRADSDNFIDGTSAGGTTVMAVDNLPCEFSRESSAEFSKVLKEFVKPIADADYTVDFDQLDLPYPIKKALILHRGELTPDYEYIREYLK